MPKAAVLTGASEPLVVRDVELDGPHDDEVRVRVVATGICHSDVSVIEYAGSGNPGVLVPMILGHEAAGIVEAVGAGVDDGLSPGDAVILMPMPQCGVCFFCSHGRPTLCEMQAHAALGGLFDGTSRFSVDGQPVFQLSCAGTWSEETVVPASSVVKISPEMPLPQAALIGCAVATGYGAVVNVAGVKPGDSVAVIGCGGVGLNAVQGARIAGAERIIAIDVLDSKLALAKSFGATDVVNADTTEPVEQVKALTGGFGVDAALEMIGRTATIQQALSMTAPGGQCVLTGLAGEEFSGSSIMDVIMVGKSIRGNLLGMQDFRVQYPRLIALYLAGDLMLDELISRRITLDEVNAGIEALEKGEVARSVIVNE